MKPVNLDKSNNTKPEEYTDWKRRVIEVTQIQDSDTDSGQYISLLIPKFSTIPRGSRLTPERLNSIIIGKNLTPQEKKLFTEILYNREAIFT